MIRLLYQGNKAWKICHNSGEITNITEEELHTLRRQMRYHISEVDL